MSVNSSGTGKRTTRTRTRRSSNTKRTDNQDQEKTDKGTAMSKTTQAGQSGKGESAENTAPTQIQVAGTAPGMPNRPIEHSDLEITGTIMGKRPIVKADSVMSVSLVHSSEIRGAMANRPVAVTNLQITSMLMNRPVASNQIDDPNTLMGFLD